MNFVPCHGDINMWRLEFTKHNSEKILCIFTPVYWRLSHLGENPGAIMNQLKDHFLLKEDLIKESTRYLGATISKYYVDGDPITKWTIGLEDNAEEAVRVIRSKVEKNGLTLKRKGSSVLPSGFKPELDGSSYVDAEGWSFYMQCIGILRWIVELGRMDICAEVSMLSAYNVAPQIGHLEAALHIFSYLISHKR